MAGSKREANHGPVLVEPTLVEPRERPGRCSALAASNPATPIPACPDIAVIRASTLIRIGAHASETDTQDGANPASALSQAGLHDCASPMGHHAGLFAALFTQTARPLVWIQDMGTLRRFGRLGARGLAQAGLDPARLVRVTARRPRDALWAMEEAVRASLDVIGEIEGAPKALDFTATRRLALFSQASRVRCLLVRTGPAAQDGGATGAPWRWRIEPASSAPDPHDAKAPGRPRWDLALLRARTRPPGRWRIETDDGAAHRLRVVPALAAGNMAKREGAGRGHVVPFRPARRSHEEA